MSTQTSAQQPQVIHRLFTATLWAVCSATLTLLLLTDPDAHIRAAYFAVAILAGMGACTRIAIASTRRHMTRFAEALERSNDANAERADAAAALAFRAHADTSHPAGYPPCPTAVPEHLYYDYVRQQPRPIGEASNVVPMPRSHRNAS